ncbi:MAG: flavin reductase family protein [Gammaproteobacteria bacterium]
MGAFDSAALRAAFGAFMTGVSVVTARAADGAPAGFTANSYTSVSLNPPLLLVCPARRLSSFAVFSSCDNFAVSILADDQREIAEFFASPHSDRFSRAAWRADAAGCPLMEGAAAFFSCRAHRRVEAGDHLILIGEITDFGREARAGLGYADGGYFTLALERRAACSSAPVAGAIVEYEGRVLLSRTPRGMSLPHAAADGAGPRAAIAAKLSAAGVRAECGAVYSVFADRRSGEYAVYYRATAADGNARGLGAYYPADDLAGMSFTSPALSEMMRRYRRERRGGEFGMYVGDETRGDVHPAGGAVAV